MGIHDLLPEGIYDCTLDGIGTANEEWEDRNTGQSFEVPFIVLTWRIEEGPRKHTVFEDRINTQTPTASGILGRKLRSLGFQFDRQPGDDLFAWIEAHGPGMKGVRARLRLKHTSSPSSGRSRAYWWYEGRVVEPDADLSKEMRARARSLLEAGIGRV